MKLFPVLAATLFQDSEAACNDGDPIFSVTCHDDLVVQLSVNKDCLDERFQDSNNNPIVKITELQINPTDATGTTPSNQCLPCTDTNPADNCQTSANFYGYDFSDDTATASAITDTTADLWFKAGQCGTSMTISADGNTATFQTDIGKPAVIDADTGIVTEQTLLETDITCDYPATISGIQMDPDMSVVADAAQDSDKIQQDDDVEAVSDDLFELKTTDADDNEIVSSDSVVLGDVVSIEVETTDDAITDYYLGTCIASNGLDTDNDNYKSLTIVTDGCMETIAAAISDDIGAIMTGTELKFKQFAFADDTQVSLTLSFEVTCDIILGTAPTDAECATEKLTDTDLTGLAGRRRRRAAASKYTETTEYKVTAGSKIADVSGDGIVVAHSGSGKATDNEADSGAVSAAVTIIAGTAVMLL